MSLRTRLMMAVLPLSILALMLLAFIQYHQGKESIMQAQTDGMRQTIKIVEQQTDDWFDWNKSEMALLATDHIFYEALAADQIAIEKAQELLGNAQEITQQYDSVLLIGADGKIILNSVKGRSVGLDLFNTDGFSPAIKKASNQAMIGSPFISPASGKPIIFIVAPILNNNKAIGYIGGTMALDKFTERVIGKLKFGESGYPFILMDNGIAFSHPVLKHILTLDIKKLGWSDQVFGKIEGQFTQTFEGIEKVYLFNFSSKHNLYYMGTAPTAEFLQAINQSRNIAIIITLLAAFSLSVILFLITQSISKKIGAVSKGVSEGATEILTASHSIASASQTLSSAATQQASSIEETSSSMEELTAMVGVNLESAKTSSSMADNLTKISELAADYTKELDSSMSKLKQSNVEIKDLEKIIESISDKTKVIDEIVFQTKLLSFNASVEAERAGEHGRGFAVVAQEVGNLAQMSGKAAQEISSIIKASMSQSHEVTQRNDKYVSEGADVLKKLKEIVESIEKASKEVEEQSNKITSASNEQHLGIKQINVAISQLDQTTQQNASISESTATASEQMLQQANSLTHLIEELEDITQGHHDEKKNLELEKIDKKSKEKKEKSKNPNDPTGGNWDEL